MRTTITLEADVAALLRAAVKQRGGSIKDTINRVLRTALPSGQQTGKSRKPYVLKSRPLGYRAGMLPSRLLAEMDEEADAA